MVGVQIEWSLAGSERGDPDLYLEVVDHNLVQLVGERERERERERRSESGEAVGCGFGEVPSKFVMGGGS